MTQLDKEMYYGEQYAIILMHQLIKASFIKEKMTIFGKRYLFNVDTILKGVEERQLFWIRRGDIVHKIDSL